MSSQERSNPSNRAGIFQKHGSGADAFHAFIPHRLPPNPPLEFTDRLRTLHEQASVAIGRLDAAALMLPNKSHFLWLYIRKEAVLSSQIEGTQSTLTNLVLHENQLAPGVPRSDVEEVSSYVRAMQYGIDRLNELPVCMRLLREVQHIIVEGSRGAVQAPGEIRRVQNWIGGSSPSNARFVPPPPNVLAQALSELEKFINDSPLPPLIRAGLAHVQFETIHPFLDGNGRVGRLLITLLLIHQKVLKEPTLYISLHFKRNREEYYERLQRVRTHGEFEAWMDFYLEGIATVATKATDTIVNLYALMEEDRSVMASRRGSHFQAAAAQNNLLVYELLCQRLLLTVSSAAAELGISRQTVRRVLQDMQSRGLVREITGKKRGQVFLYQRFLDILEEGT